MVMLTAKLLDSYCHLLSLNACFPIVEIPIFFAISDFSGSIISTYPRQNVVKAVPAQIGHLSPSVITFLHCLHALSAVISSPLFCVRLFRLWAALFSQACRRSFFPLPLLPFCQSPSIPFFQGQAASLLAPFLNSK